MANKQKSFGFTSFEEEMAYYRNGGGFKRCYESHPAMVLKDDIVIYGGSCSSPMVKDADVYVGLDYSMKRALVYPWEVQPSNPAVEIYFPIKDMSVPENPTRFKALIEWLALQLIAGKKVHVGCIGGHGRTGMVLSALYAHMTGKTNAIAYVRANYCPKAVETIEQSNWLAKHFGVEVEKGYKDSTSTGGWASSKQSKSIGAGYKPKTTKSTSTQDLALFGGSLSTSGKRIEPVASPRNIW